MTCRSRSFVAGIVLFVPLIGASASAFAAELPPVKASASNPVATCATPGRLMAYVRERNTKLDPKFDVIATEYMRHGEALSVRWDYAFFQMLLETGYLTYTGDVKPSQNNFAGLGATGGGVRGESFKDVSTGARAHLEHLLMYTGQKIENPVAERTRNIQEWGVLESWQKKLDGPLTFTQLAKQWAPGSRGYATDITAIAERFFNGACKGDDPNPELVAEARGETGAVAQKTAASKAATDVAAADAPTKGVEAARRAVDDARNEGASQRFALGATAMLSPAVIPPPAAKAPAVTGTAVTGTLAPAAAAAAKTAPPPAVTVLNATEDDVRAAEKPVQVATTVTGAAAAGAAKDAGKLDSKAEGKSDTKADKKSASGGACRVWTASYGGAKAIIIKALTDKTVNYTVLDVNEGTEKREADAYISAYAKGGESVGEFTNQSQALEKAFELCPEG